MYMPTRFIWDENKNRANRRKHKISFETATKVFTDPYVVIHPDQCVEGEQRWQAIGSVAGLSIILVAHTARDEGGGEVIRIISARKATTTERKSYEEAN